MLSYIPDAFIILFFLSFIIFRLFFSEQLAKKIFSKISIIFGLIGWLLMFSCSLSEEVFATDFLIYDSDTYFLKSILMACATLYFATINISKSYKNYDSILYIIAFSIICSFIFCLSANNFLILFLGIEGLVFSICFLLMTSKTKEFRSQNALKYFVTSSIATTIFLYGCSLYYSEFGSLCFSQIGSKLNVVVVSGTILIFCALLFEIHAAAFHSWAIDIYEKAPMRVVMFLDSAFLFFMFFVFAKTVSILIWRGILFYKPFLCFISIASMAIGGLMPFLQKNIKKFAAYSSIGHIGFAMTILASARYPTEFKISMFYIATYAAASLGFFCCILNIKKNAQITEFSDLKGCLSHTPVVGYILVLTMFAMVASPPFVNFFAKMNILKFLIRSNDYILLWSATIYSILSFLYTIKALRFLFIDKKSDDAVRSQQKFYIALLPLILLILSNFFSNQIQNSFSSIFIDKSS